ncbi:RebB family R body protein [Shewanella abyssi]|uniref:RebB family R body protein n=1 Tax=Shewanella abyssi TaxID=311789 RepID=UPI0020103412|nr:RebB family R body protein [Shewanella abyssi]MCL1051844.1 RebB family R body protein [Shewanella abyssi]
MATPFTADYEQNIAVAPSFSMAITDVVMANTIGLLMANAVSNEAHSQSIQNACVNQCCVMILGATAAGIVNGSKAANK